MVKHQIVREIHRSARKNFVRRSVNLKGINDLWQADLIDFKSLKKYNNGYTYILVVIDCLTKYAWAVPLKSKSARCAVDAFNQILSTSGSRPANLQTDMGTEFYNESFQRLMQSFNINHYSSYSTKKASIVERLIRTLKNKLHISFSCNGSYKWVGKTLVDVLRTYNNSKHRITKHKPIDVTSENEEEVISNIRTFNKKQNNKQKNKLKIGDYVRISKYKSSFDKGYTPNWSTEIFTIKTVNSTSPVTYNIVDQRNQPILGSFYREELQKTNYPNVYLVEKVIKRKGNKCLVKWLGLSDRENSWIDHSSMIQ